MDTYSTTSESVSADATASSPAKHPRDNLFVRAERRLVERLLAGIGNPPIAVQLNGGEEIRIAESVLGTVCFRDRGALWKVLLDPLYQFGEMYVAGRVEVDADLTELLQAIQWTQMGNSWKGKFTHWIHFPRGNTLSRSRQNVYHHYDIGNDFYQLWLDEQLLYTCAYFSHRGASLEEAQLAKMDHVCRKLQLQPDEEVIEAGCGWGAFALHMARHYGARVRAYNVSREQIRFARERAEREGLSDRVEYVEDDWRNIRGRCDVFVSVGMLEHVGRKHYRELGRTIDRVLRDTGRGLIHSIGQNKSAPLNPWIEQRIFPGAYPPALKEMLEIFEVRDFSVLDVENLRLHYAETLRHWLNRFDEHGEEIRAHFDERFVRTWRLYLVGSITAFLSGSLQLFQILFSREQNNDIAWTREHLYR